MKAILIDLDGTVYEGDDAVAGAAETVDWLRRDDIAHRFVTNTTTLSREALSRKLADLGIEAPVERIQTPPVAACGWLARRAPGPVALFVPESAREDFAGVERLPDDAESGAAAVVVGDLGEDWDFATLNRAFRLLTASSADGSRPALVALGLTRFAEDEDGLLSLDVGPFVKALEYAADCEAVVLGKPSQAFFEAALSQLDCEPGDAAMVGDDIDGDVGGARHAGIAGVLVRTGKFRDEDLEGDIQPDAVLGSIAELQEWWEASG